MAEVSWFSQASPGGVSVAGATVDAGVLGATPTDVLVVTEGGVVYRRRRDGTAWRWKRVGTPPGGAGVEGLSCVVGDPSGAVSPVVIGGADLHVWLGGPDAVASTWLDLGRPEPNSWLVAAHTSRQATGLKHLLVLGNDAQAPWLREGVDADGTWFSIASDAEWGVTELSLAAASSAPGEEPVPHIFAVTRDPDGFASSLRVAVRAHSVWTWVDPGPRPDGANIVGLSTTSFRDGTGALKAAALVGVSPGEPVGTAWMLVGSGAIWRWEEVGRPPGDFGLRTAVVAVKGTDPVAGEEPVVVARAGHDLWTWSRTGDWVNLGTTPGDVTVADPVASFDVTTPSGRKVWAAAVGRDAHLWTAEVEGAAVRWEDHGVPSTVTSIVGAYTDPQDPGMAGRMAHQYVIDDLGHLWGSSQGDLFNPWWDEQGRPTLTANCAAGVGTLSIGEFGTQRTFAFVLGSDGHLWARTPVPEGGAWVDHGVPPDRRVRATLPPIAAGPPPHEPCVPVLGDDGQLWLRTAAGLDWRWDNRSAPPGRLIFALVGAGTLAPEQGRQPIVAVVADDGHLWLNEPRDGASNWVDLGAPTAGEKVAAGIGGEVTIGPGGDGMNVVVVGTPSGHVWGRDWEPGGGGTWADLGSPGGARIHAGIGVIPDPHVAGGRLLLVIGGDQQLWAHGGVQGVQWMQWGLPRETSALSDGRAVVLDPLGPQPVAMMLGVDRRLWMATPGQPA